MAQETPPICFEDIPLEEARRLSRGPRMDPRLYEALKARIHGLPDLAVRVSIRPDEHATTMKHRILRVADELTIPVTVRRVAGGLIF